MNIKEMLENSNYIILLDTNVLLNVYRYSPDFSEFALDCLKSVSDFIYLTATVRLEYEKHHRSEFSKMVKRIKEATQETEKQIRLAKDKILGSCDRLEHLQFHSIDELKKQLSQKLESVQQTFNSFFEERASLNLTQNYWEGNDYLLQLVQEIENFDHILQSPSQKEIYSWCDEGEKRFKNGTPPGFKDAKNKDGVRKYSDLIIWMETLRFAKKYKKNVIFVTDDLKTDWWEDKDGAKVFHSKLIAEFSKTKQIIEPMMSQTFFDEVSKAYDVQQTDSIEMALQMTDEDYCNKIAEEVFDKIYSHLEYYATNYIIDDTHIGSEGIEEFEILDHTFINAERVERYNDNVIYEFNYSVEISGTSYEYWGRDDDTKEVITSPGIDHIFEGSIKVRVEREAEPFLDFEGDNCFEDAEIIDGDLCEIEFYDRMDTPEPGEFGYCPDCGEPLNFDNNGGSGFCTNCAPNH